MPLKPNEGNAVRVPYLRCQKCQPPSHPHHPNSQPPTLCLAQHPNPMLYRKQRLCRLPQRPHSQPLNSQQRHCQQIRKRASKTQCQSRNMDRKNLKTIRTTDIAKILSHAPSLTLRCDVRNDIANTLRTLWVGLFGQRPTAYAQSRKWVAQTVENNYEVESSKELLIRLSWVRPPLVPPNLKALWISIQSAFFMHAWFRASLYFVLGGHPTDFAAEALKTCRTKTARTNAAHSGLGRSVMRLQLLPVWRSVRASVLPER